MQCSMHIGRWSLPLHLQEISSNDGDLHRWSAAGNVWVSRPGDGARTVGGEAHEMQWLRESKRSTCRRDRPRSDVRSSSSKSIRSPPVTPFCCRTAAASSRQQPCFARTHCTHLDSVTSFCSSGTSSAGLPVVRGSLSDLAGKHCTWKVAAISGGNPISSISFTTSFVEYLPPRNMRASQLTCSGSQGPNRDWLPCSLSLKGSRLRQEADHGPQHQTACSWFAWDTLHVAGGI